MTNASSGAVPVLLPFRPGTDNPVSGPAYTMVRVTIPAGALSGTASINPAQIAMSDCQSAVINNTANNFAVTVTVDVALSWKVAAAGLDIVPVYWNGGMMFLGATLDSVQAQDTIIQIVLFTVRQPPASVLSQIEVYGTLNAFITNANIAVTGNVNANITNASLAVTGNVNATVSGNVNANITNASLAITGNVGITSGSVNANITNATVNTNGSLNNNFIVQAPLLNDVTAQVVSPSLAFQNYVASQFTNTAQYTWQVGLAAKRRRQSLIIVNSLSSAGVMLISADGTTPMVSLAAGASFTGLSGYQGIIYQWSQAASPYVTGWYNQVVQPDFSLSPLANTFTAAGAANNPYNITTGKSLTGNGSVINALPGGRNWQIDGWMYYTANPSAQSTVFWIALPGASTSYMTLFVDTSGKINLKWVDRFGTVALFNLTTITLNFWTFFSIVSTATGLGLYINNALSQSTQYFVSPLSKQASLYIGIASDLASFPSQGQIAELAIWKTPQIPSVQSNYNPPLMPCEGNEPGLFSLYHFSGDMLDYGPGVLS